MLDFSQPVLMGIVNVTPDSFSDGDPDATVASQLQRARQLIEDGAHILDVGGESTRPQAVTVSLDQECQRVLPFLEAFRKEFPDFPISLDTKKYDLALRAKGYGVTVFNDVSFLADERFVELACDEGAYYVLMHARGDSQSMMALTEYKQGVVEGVRQELQAKAKRVLDLGLGAGKLILDLGFGFAKTPEQCATLIEFLPTWQSEPYTKLFGVSRKRFLQLYTGECGPVERDAVSCELGQKAWQSGFSVLRVHDVKGMRKALLA